MNQKEKKELRKLLYKINVIDMDAYNDSQADDITLLLSYLSIISDFYHMSAKEKEELDKYFNEKNKE